MFLLFPGKTNGHGSQGMARHRVVEAVGSGFEQRSGPGFSGSPSRQVPNTGVRPQTKVMDRGPRRNPEENCAAAQATVRRLEVALASLEESDMAAREAIQTSLVKARVAARVIPVSDRIIECRSFIERAERRVTKAEEAVEAAVS